MRALGEFTVFCVKWVLGAALMAVGFGLLVPGVPVLLLWAGSEGWLDWLRDPAAVPTIEGALLWFAVWFVGAWALALSVWGGGLGLMMLGGQLCEIDG